MPNNEYLVDCTLFHSNGIDRSGEVICDTVALLQLFFTVIVLFFKVLR